MDIKALELLTLAMDPMDFNARYFRISKGYTLQRWSDGTLGYHTAQGQTIVHGITKATLEMANAKINYSLQALPSGMLEEAMKLEEQGILERCTYGATVYPAVDYDNHYVRAVQWAITGRCNFKCKHCFLSAPDARFGELSTEECKRIIAEMAECGISTVSLSGGEPLVRSDFMEIVKEFQLHGITVKAISTNGSLVNEKLLNQLEEIGVTPSFSMSFDGVGCHDWLRGIDGAERLLMKKFELLAHRGFQTSSSFTLHKGNAGVLRESINRLVSVGVKMVIVNRMVDVGEWIKNGRGKGLTQRETLEVYLKYLPAFFEDGMPVTVVLNRMLKLHAGKNDYQITPIRVKRDCHKKRLCSTVYELAFLNGDGKLAPCIPIAGMDGQQENFADLTKMHLRDALEKSRYAACVGATVKDYYDANPECAACEYREYCQGGCRAQALEFDDTNYMGMDRHRCEFFKDQFTERILQRMAETVPQARCVNLPEDYPLKPLD